jgi:hypothetical protein
MGAGLGPPPGASGRIKLNAASPSEARPATMNVHRAAALAASPVSGLASAVLSQFTRPVVCAASTAGQLTKMSVNGQAARIHPIVPPMRTMPNSLSGFFMLAKAIELVIEIVGTYRRQWTSISPKNGRKDRVKPHPSIAKPPIRWDAASTRSGDFERSAHWLLKNMPTIEATGNALRMSDCWPGPNPRLGR